ncbi:MAG: methylaspartate mutase [Deltaproteobacteria bacterium]|nr:methylaspartate mutase [Deltaproteobacteria bacterium]
MTPEQANVIAITDCGSTTTKAILIEKVDGVFRQTFRGEAPTTVEAPVEDVTRGVVAALEDLSALTGRRLVDDDGQIIRPRQGQSGVDIYISTSSAGGGLQMMVAGVVRKISAESAERAALGAGAIVADVVACDDNRPLYEQIDRMRKLRPDMVLLAGGVDGGADIQVVEMAELLAAADPRPRFGDGFRLPVIFAGNREVQGEIESTLKKKCDLFTVDNIRPEIEKEHLGPARDRIHNLFLEHVMRQAPGFSRLVDWTDAPVTPTPSAVGDILKLMSDNSGLSLLCVDIGGATTDLFSVVDGVFNRTVSANLGLSYSATNVLAECGAEGLARWLPFAEDETALRDMVMNKTIRPTTIPDSYRDLFIEQALAREALRLSFAHHRAFAVGLKGGQKDRNIDGALGIGTDEELLNPMDLDLIIGSGGVLSHAPRPTQTAAMLVDSFLPEGVTRLAKDSIFMMPHLGVLSHLLPDVARSVFERDCLVDLGTCVAPVGKMARGKSCLSYRLESDGEPVVSGNLTAGELKVVPLLESSNAMLELMPANKLDVGAGRGKRWKGQVRGGPAGLILDGRGRPIDWPNDPANRTTAMTSWLTAFGAIDEGWRDF